MYVAKTVPVCSKNGTYPWEGAGTLAGEHGRARAAVEDLCSTMQHARVRIGGHTRIAEGSKSTRPSRGPRVDYAQKMQGMQRASPGTASAKAEVDASYWTAVPRTRGSRGPSRAKWVGQCPSHFRQNAAASVGGVSGGVEDQSHAPGFWPRCTACPRVMTEDEPRATGRRWAA